MLKRNLASATLVLLCIGTAAAQPVKAPSPQPGQVCYFAGQPYSIGAVLNNRVCDVDPWHTPSGPPTWQEQTADALQDSPAPSYASQGNGK